MKTLRFLLWAFLLVAGFTACSKDVEDEAPVYTDVEIKECIEGEIIELVDNSYMVRLLVESKALPAKGQIYINVLFPTNNLPVKYSKGDVISFVINSYYYVEPIGGDLMDSMTFECIVSPCN